jgi:hypothetical protein
MLFYAFYLKINFLFLNLFPQTKIPTIGLNNKKLSNSNLYLNSLNSSWAVSPLLPVSLYLHKTLFNLNKISCKLPANRDTSLFLNNLSSSSLHFKNIIFLNLINKYNLKSNTSFELPKVSNKLNYKFNTQKTDKIFINSLNFNIQKIFMNTINQNLKLAKQNK